MIDEYTYGCFKVEGKQFLGDLKIQSNRPRYWQDLEEKKLKVSHISELLNENPDVFVIGTGAGGLLKVGAEVEEYILSWKLNTGMNPMSYIEKNVKAIKIINEAIKNGKNVCAVLPSGC
ncbi:hypothetical protein HOM13_03365 [Candidatus Woesearchaeota archaeon]|jgi:hypothetical protein|nr:hypothetical protein [Candidatus Woesearchaeota archaeon]MBT5215748.1 hypothetical protein [Candidatus Woesearchaeota archaeon]MBT6402581.1 hypothetical protein [Candidatus Woesearchaeota archaeon]